MNRIECVCVMCGDFVPTFFFLILLFFVLLFNRCMIFTWTLCLILSFFFAFINGRFIFREVFFSSSPFFFICLFVSSTVIKLIVNREFCTEFRIRDNTSMHHRCLDWNGLRHSHPTRARIHGVFSQFKKNIYNTPTAERKKGTTKTKHCGQMQTTKQNDNSMECLKSTVIFNTNNNRFVFFFVRECEARTPLFSLPHMYSFVFYFLQLFRSFF